MSLYVQGRIINFMVVELCAEYKISYANVFSQRFVKNTRKSDDAKLVFDPLGRPGKLGSTENFCNFGKVKEGHCVLFFCHSHSHSHSHNAIGNVYLLFLSKATG